MKRLSLQKSFKKKGKLKHFIPITTLLLLFIFSHRVWFDPSAIVSNGDWTYFYPESLSTLQWGSWMATFLFGDINFYPLRFLMSVVGQIVVQVGFNEQVGNMLLFFLPISLIGPPSIYFLLYRFSSNRFASFLGSLFYLFNTLFLVYSTAAYPIIFVYALMPLAFLLFDKAITNFSYFNGLLLVFIVSLLSFYELRYVFLLVLVLITYFIFKFFVIDKSAIDLYFFKKNWVILLALLLITLALNFYIIVFSFSSSMQMALHTGVSSRTLIKPGWLFIKNSLTTFYPFWTGNQPTMFFSQPIPWIFWTVPLYALLSIFFRKRNKWIIFFILVGGITVFLGKGPSEPFGEIYEWVYYNLPVFSFFRESSKFWFVLLLSYSILITCVITYSFEYIHKKRISKILSKITQTIIVLPILIIVTMTMWPALTQELGPGYYSINIPKELIALKDRFVHDENFYRVLQLPQLSRYIFFSETHPRSTFVELPDTLRTLSPYALRLLGIKYVVVSHDPFYEVFPGNSPRDTYTYALAQKKGLKKMSIKDIGEIELYKNSLGSVPHIYTTNTLAFLQGDATNLESIIPLLDLKNSNIIVNTTQEDEASLSSLNYLKAAVANQFYISRCTNCLDNIASQTGQFRTIHRDKKASVDLFVPNYGIENIKVTINNKTYNLTSQDKWFVAKGVVLEKGNNKTEVQYLNKTTLFDKDYRFPLDKNESFDIEIEDIHDYQSYVLTFEYRIPMGLETNFTLKQNTDLYFQYQQYKPGGTSWRAYNGQLTADGKVYELSVAFKAAFGSRNAKLSFTPEQVNKTKDRVQVKKIKIIMASTPELIFKEKLPTFINQLKLPSIIYQTINPTKHIVEIKDAANPYTLVFAEKYSPFWKAKIIDSTSTIKDKENAFSTDSPSVREAPAQNSYDIGSLILSNNKQLDIKKHFMINDFANAWYVNKIGSYTMELSFSPQRVFVLSVLFSAVSALIVIAMLIFMFARKIANLSKPMLENED